MITMEMLGKVKRMYTRDKKSLHQISKQTGLSRNTICKWVKDAQKKEEPKYLRQEMPGKLTAFHEALELVLKADALRTKQYQRTARALCVELKTQGYTGGCSRRRIWLDAQKLTWNSFDELNAWLGQRCRDCWREIRHPESTEFSVLEMLEKERQVLMPMPTAFDGYVEKSAKVSNTSQETKLTVPDFQAPAATGVSTKPSVVARRLSAATLRASCCSS